MIVVASKGMTSPGVLINKSAWLGHNFPERYQPLLDVVAVRALGGPAAGDIRRMVEWPSIPVLELGGKPRRWSRR